MNGDRQFSAWFAFTALLSAVWLAFLMWAGYQFVTWVTAQ